MMFDKINVHYCFFYFFSAAKMYRIINNNNNHSIKESFYPLYSKANHIFD